MAGGRPRSFVCPDDVWVTCERLAWQSGRPVDDVVNDALVRYLQSVPGIAPPPPPGPPPFPPTLITPQAPGYPPPPPVRPASAAPPPPYAPPPAAPMAPPPPPVAPTYPSPRPPPQHSPTPPPGYGGRPQYPAPPTPPPPFPGGGPPFPGPAPGGGAPGPMSDGPPSYPIFLYCEGQRAQIMQPRFIIGRSRNASDFAINDSNVSRQHAAVEWLRGHYHIVDMGSTNGIQFQGRRVERKVIYDGDVIILAGHTLRFARQ